MASWRAFLITYIIVFLSGGGLCFEEDDVITTDSQMDVVIKETQYLSFVRKMLLLKQRRRVKPSDVAFRLFNRDGNSELDLNLGKPPDFRSDRKTKILIHGFVSSGRIYMDAVIGYLSTGDYNVIIVDWANASRCWHSKRNVYAFLPVCYFHAVHHHITAVGRLMAQLLDILFTKSEVDNIHIIGHSLGAHIAGIAGAKHKVGRITGLDPAKPLLVSSKQMLVLNKTDAKFVDVIHTSIGWLGWTSPLGHADFYPNEGKTPQPGCKSNTNDLIKTCSHSRAHEYFTESIRGSYFYEFAATPCSCAVDVISRSLCSGEATTVMGEHTTTSARGIFYVETAGRSPFAVIFGRSNGVTRASSVSLFTFLMHMLRYFN